MNWSIYDCERTPTETDNFAIAQFRLAVPEGVTQPKRILALVAGINHDGRDWWLDDHWQSFAREHDCAVFCPWFTMSEGIEASEIYGGTRPIIEYYGVATGGSGAAFFSALEQLCTQADFENSSSIPLYLYGHSAGGIFNHNLALFAPERISAFTVNKGGGCYLVPNEAIKKIPGIFFIGEEDLARRNGTIETSYEDGKREGAPWILVRESGIAHELGMSEYMTQAFFAQLWKADEDSVG